MGEWWRSKDRPRHTVTDGIRWGIGFYIGTWIMKFVDGLIVRNLRSRARTPSPQLAQRIICAGPAKAFEECLNSNGSSISECQSFMESLSECLKSSTAPPQIRVSGDNARREARDVQVRVKFKSDKPDNV